MSNPSTCFVFCGYCGQKIAEENYNYHLWEIHRIGQENKKIEELKAENKKLRDALRMANEKLDSCNRRLNRTMDDSFNDIMADRDDYR